MWNETKIKLKQNWTKLFADSEQFVLFQFHFNISHMWNKSAEKNMKLGVAFQAHLAVDHSVSLWPCISSPSNKPRSSPLLIGWDTWNSFTICIFIDMSIKIIMSLKQLWNSFRVFSGVLFQFHFTFVWKFCFSFISVSFHVRAVGLRHFF